MQQMSPPRPLLARELVGRECELEHLGEALLRAAAGRLQFVLLSGESGVGKTRLCRAFLDKSREQQTLSFWGRALPQDQAVPFGPFLDAFRHSFDGSASPLLLPDQSLMPSFAFLVQLLPELAGRFPDLTMPMQDKLPAPTQRQAALFHDLLLGLQALTKLHQLPLLLVLEDLHWADETSLEFLTYLARRLDVSSTSSERSTPLLILGTYRSEALAESPALQLMLWHLQALRQVTELHLAPLTRLDHRQIVSSILDQAIPEEFADFLFQWDEGNPFYAEEFLGTLAATGQLQAKPHGQGWELPQQDRPPLPSSISAAILQRFVRLPPVDQEVLTIASVIGRTFDLGLLAAVCDLDEHALVSVLSRAISRQFLSEVTTTTSLGFVEPLSVQYHFRHALIRETIYDRIHTVECRLRHRTVAEAIEQLPSLDHVASLLALHYRLAGLPDQACPYALQAAQQASMLAAFREERFHLEVAQASLPQESPKRLQLLERLGMVSMAIHDFSGALHWLSLAKEGYEQSGQSSHVLPVLALLIMPARFLASHALPGLLAEIETRIETTFASGDHTHWDVNLLDAASIFTAYQVMNCDYHRIYRLAERNNELFEFLTDPQKVAAIQSSNITYHYARANQHTQFVEESIAEIRHALRNAHQYSLPHVVMFSYWLLTPLLIFAGHLDETKQLVGEIIEYEQYSGVPRASDVIGWMYFFSGEQWEQGMQSLRNNIQNMMHTNILASVAVDSVVLAHLLLARNELGEALTYLRIAEPLQERLNENRLFLLVEWGFAKLHAAQRNLSEAGEWYERILERWKTTQERLFILPILKDGVAFYAQIDNLVRAQDWLIELQMVVKATENPVGAAALLEAQGIIAVKQKRLQPALEALRQAVQAWGRLKFRYQQALAAHRLAEILLQQAAKKALENKARQQARQEAEGLLQQAALIYEQLGIVDQAEAVQRLRGHTRLDAQQKRRRTLAAHHQAGGLTPRELQTLQLLAVGKTNNEIARTLGISLSTVELHVTHILTKLNCENRTQAVVHAVSKGWVTTPS